MLEQFLNHITENKLVAPGDKILLAVSGGIDSMVMADLFMRAGFPAGPPDGTRPPVRLVVGRAPVGS